MATNADTIRRTNEDGVGLTLENVGAKVIRYGLVIILISVGSLKFTAYEAEGIQGLVSNSPIMSWAYSVFSVRSFSAILGVIEIGLGVLIAARSFAPKVSAIGSIGSIIMFLITLSFLLTTPGVWQAGYGFPFPSPMPGQFLVKDILLLGAAIWTAGEALRAANRQRVVNNNNI